MPKDPKFFFRIVYERGKGVERETSEEVVECWSRGAAATHGYLTCRGHCDFPKLERDGGWKIASIERVGPDSMSAFNQAKARARRNQQRLEDSR